MFSRNNDHGVGRVRSEGGRSRRRQRRRAVPVPMGRGGGSPGARHRRYAGLQQPRRAHAHAQQHLRARDQGNVKQHAIVFSILQNIIEVVFQDLSKGKNLI